ncbi:creatininase family protein [Pelagicoccus albus]|uniref:Creatininase family protein n=1 Tax=Pelagicoccus albus TaxID=415222 RepID=A0A7X1EBL0_9BACT|nr:creatininase family protein [Pelagicoccus albus]MBC2607927.1 creatininase family protein [Pelagicoccus albus]
MSFPSYRKFYLPSYSPSQIEAFPNKESALVIIPTGAIEQHGPQLPVAVDSLMGQAWLSLALPKVPEGTPVFVTPPVTIGKSNEHVGYPGTLFVPAKILRRLVHSIFQQCYGWGFRKFAFLNTHGGNMSVVRACMQEFQAEKSDISTCFLRSGFAPPISKQEAAFGFHANQVETAWMMAATEDHQLVDSTYLPCEYPGSVDDPAELRAECAPATYSWVTADISDSGVIGDASLATIEDGREWLDKGAAALAESIVTLCNQ